LNKDENAELVALTQKGRPGARKIKRANILLLADTKSVPGNLNGTLLGQLSIGVSRSLMPGINSRNCTR
jgi:hypothetical protein